MWLSPLTSTLPPRRGVPHHAAEIILSVVAQRGGTPPRRGGACPPRGGNSPRAFCLSTYTPLRPGGVLPVRSGAARRSGDPTWWILPTYVVLGCAGLGIQYHTRGGGDTFIVVGSD